MSKNASLVHNCVVLTVITLAAGCILGGVHYITAGPIAAQKKATSDAAMKEVFADAASFEEIEWDSKDSDFADVLTEAGLDQTNVYSVSKALDASGNQLGYVVDAGNNEGYGGEVELMVGIGADDAGMIINGISFLNLEETAGMGSKAEEPAFKDQFDGITLGDEAAIKYVKNGKSASNEIDAISGCTITTNAVTKAVNGALSAANTLKEEK